MFSSTATQSRVTKSSRSWPRLNPHIEDLLMATMLTILAAIIPTAAAHAATPTQSSAPADVKFGTVKIDGLNIAYREAGDSSSPKLVLLHGFPASSHQYRDLIRVLGDKFHVIAPDYPGFGNSDTPDPAKYAYTFDKLSEVVEAFLAVKGFDHYGLFVQDYGGPVGFRILGRHPESLDWLIIQNTNAYEVGFTAAWDGFRGALWKNRTPETEKPLAGFLTRCDQEHLPARRQEPGPDEPGQLGVGLGLHAAATCRSHEPRPLLRLPHQRAAVSEVASLPA